ncbi:hypothetical protein D3C72_1660810 [compost metagenome]
MQAVGHVADELALFAGAHVHEQGVAVLHQLPGHRGRHAAGVGPVLFDGLRARLFEGGRQGDDIFNFHGHAVRLLLYVGHSIFLDGDNHHCRSAKAKVKRLKSRFLTTL